MKKLLITLTLLVPLTAFPQQEVKTDSLSTTLDEVVVNADSQTETSKYSLMNSPLSPPPRLSRLNISATREGNTLAAVLC